MPTITQHDFKEDTDTLTVTEPYFNLIVWNDEVNTFEWVIEALVDICGHSKEQAEQCGSYEMLKPQCDAITDRGISASIDVTAN